MKEVAHCWMVFKSGADRSAKKYRQDTIRIESERIGRFDQRSEVGRILVAEAGENLEKRREEKKGKIKSLICAAAAAAAAGGGVNTSRESCTSATLSLQVSLQIARRSIIAFRKNEHPKASASSFSFLHLSRCVCFFLFNIFISRFHCSPPLLI